MDNNDTELTQQQRALLELTENEMDLSSRMKLKHLLETDEASRDDYAAMQALRLLQAERRIEAKASAFERRIEQRLGETDASRNLELTNKNTQSEPSALKRLLSQLTRTRWVVALQAVVIVVMGVNLYVPTMPTEEVYRSQFMSECYPFIVQFKADAQFGDIQRVLVQANIKITAGPSPAGEYELSAPGKTLEQVKNVLVDVVQVVEFNKRCER